MCPLAPFAPKRKARREHMLGAGRLLETRGTTRFGGPSRCIMRGPPTLRARNAQQPRSMPCPLLTVGLRRALLAVIVTAFAPRRGPADSTYRAWRVASARRRPPGFHSPRLAAARAPRTRPSRRCDLSSRPLSGPDASRCRHYIRRFPRSSSSPQVVILMAQCAEVQASTICPAGFVVEYGGRLTSLLPPGRPGVMRRGTRRARHGDGADGRSEE